MPLTAPVAVVALQETVDKLGAEETVLLLLDIW
jgi:hypothetical protein